jgi:hypothetical protein
MTDRVSEIHRRIVEETVAPKGRDTRRHAS